MAVELSWFDDKHTVLLFKFRDPWTWQEFQRANAAGARSAAKSHHTVHAIFDVREASLLSGRLFPFFTAAQETVDAPNQGVTMIFRDTESQSLIERLAASIIRTVPGMKDRLLLVSSFAELEQYLMEIATTAQH